MKINGLAGLQAAFGATFDDEYNERVARERDDLDRQLDWAAARREAADLMLHVSQSKLWPKHPDGSVVTLKEMRAAHKLLKDTDYSEARVKLAKRALDFWAKEHAYMTKEETLSAAELRELKG